MGDDINDEIARALIHTACDRLAVGDGKHAAQLLIDAACTTHDLNIERQVRELAEQERELARRFHKGRWTEVIRIADLRTEQVLLD
jgi:hypothetical protein